jgi:hypothetical protein
MASQRIVVMVSSRCVDNITGASGGSVPLTEVRARVKRAVEGMRLFERETFECWVHEDEPAMDLGEDFWQQCLDRVRSANIVLVLYNGNAGFGKEANGIGICHAELMAALAVAGDRVRLVDVRKANVGKLTGHEAANLRFQEFVDSQSRGTRFATNDDEAVERLVEALQDAVVQMVRQGSAGARRGRFDTGASLDWSRLSFASRKAAMERVLRERLHPDGATDVGRGVVLKFDGVQLYVCCHAVPAAMTVAAAREMVGRPFLRDHEVAADLEPGVFGPVHVIACHKGVTENQASALLGFPDATIVTPPFGVYVADNTQKIQLIFLANCRDESSTRYAAQRLFDWLLQSGESRHLAQRATGRTAIVKAIASQLARSWSSDSVG